MINTLQNEETQSIHSKESSLISCNKKSVEYLDNLEICNDL